MSSFRALMKGRTDTEPSLDFWRTFTDSLPDMLLLVDIDGVIIYVNHVPDGVSRSEVIGSSAFDYVPAESRSDLRRSLIEIFQGGAARMRVQRGIHTDGTQRWYSIHTGPVKEREKVVAAVIVARDVTTQRNAEVQLAESEARCRVLVENAPEAIVVYDIDLGRFVDANQQACTLFGMSMPDLLGCNPLGWNPVAQPNGPDFGSKARRLIAETLGGGTPCFAWTHRRPTGEDVECEVRLVRLPSRDRRLVRGSVTDVTERRRTESQLHEWQKMDALGKLAAGIAHDFRNLLTVIGATAQLLEYDSMEPQSKEDANAILAEVRRGMALTTQLLQFAKRQAPPYEIVDLNEVAREIAGTAGRVMSRRIAIEVKLADEPMFVAVSRSRLEQVVMNLLLNSRDAIEGDGWIKVETSHCTTEVRLSVMDSGSGMTEAVRSQAMKAFFTTKDPSQGSGLGLSTVNAIVLEARGKIDITSAQGEGTTVNITLPRTDYTAPAAAA